LRARRFDWEGAAATASAIRAWSMAGATEVDVRPIERAVRAEGDRAVLELTARFDATESSPESLQVEAGAGAAALAALDPALREALEVAAANITAVAEAQAAVAPKLVELPQGQTVSIREVPVSSAGIYAPGGKAAYPSSVLMCAIPARAAGVGRIALATPPSPDGTIAPLVLAAAELCGIEEIYAMGGAQAIFALAYGTETVEPVDVIAGPGNAWVREAKRAAYGQVGIDSLAGPSELMVIAGPEVDPEWVALDLCAQAEHGADGPLLIAAVEDATIDALATATEAAAAARTGIGDAPLALVRAPDMTEAIKLANAYAPEHLELLDPEAAALAEAATTAGCVFVGAASATAFGDYAAGSNHVLPTGGAGRFSGPLGPSAFRRSIANVRVPEAAAAALAPVVEAISQAEGFPVHGESAMIRK